jgi:hypothetical protein
MNAVDVDTSRVDAGRSRSRTPRVLVVMAALCVATWLGAALLSAVPRTDAEGRLVLFVWHRTSGWWQGSLTMTASALTLVLAVWLPVVAVRRWVPPRWRALTASVGSVVVIAVGGYLAVLSFLSLALVGAEGSQTLLTGAGGRRVLVTQDGFDGDVVAVYSDGQTWLCAAVAIAKKLDTSMGGVFTTSPCSTASSDFPAAHPSQSRRAMSSRRSSISVVPVARASSW